MTRKNAKLCNVQDLWAYCMYCPVCQDMCREVMVDILLRGDLNYMFDVEKKDQFLTLKWPSKRKDRLLEPKRASKHGAPITYVIDCMKNTFEIDSENPAALNNPTFYLQGTCYGCNDSVAYGADMEMDVETGTIPDIGLEAESIELADDNHDYSITIDYHRDEMLISVYDPKYDGDSDQTPKQTALPIIKLDYSDKQKVIQKLSTLLLFS
jgi:hypothetical protein